MQYTVWLASKFHDRRTVEADTPEEAAEAYAENTNLDSAGVVFTVPKKVLVGVTCEPEVTFRTTRII